MEATISNVITEKSYAVTRVKGGNLHGKTVTFHLECWKGSSPPRVHQVVKLAEVSKYEQGWRAAKAEPIMAE